MIRIKRIFCLSLAVILSLLTLSGCGGNKNIGFTVKPQKSGDSSSFNETDGIVTIENTDYRLELDSKTTHFNVIDLKNKVKYSSIPDFKADIISEETQKEFVSELVISYFNSRSGEFFMYSTADSVEKNNSLVTASSDAIRVTYNFGETNSEYFVPAVMTVDTYEAVLDKLSSSGKRRFGFYYEFWSSSEPTKEFDEMAEKYPVLKKRDLYILSETISESDHKNIDKYMSEAGYTQEEYKKLLKELDFSVATADKPGFTIPVEYKLTENGFSATVLTDLITEKSENFKLSNIKLLPYFASVDSNAKGYMLVPDGAGALIEINSKKVGSYVHRIYGEDVSAIIEEQAMLKQNQYLPVFGMTHGSGAYLAVCEGAAAVADINAQVFSDSTPANRAWLSFHYRTIESVKNSQAGSAAGTAEGVYNLYGRTNSTELPTVRYILLKPESDYVSMASAYRKYLTENEQINEKSGKEGMLLEYTCVMTEKRTSLGVPYTEKIVLTTLKDIKDSLNSLYKSGVKNISVKLNAYTDSGLNNKAFNSFSLYKKVGSREELKELSDLINKNGGRLYLDADFTTVYKDSVGDGFSEKSDISYYLDKTLVKAANYDVVTRKINNEKSPYYISPLQFTNISASFIDDISDLDKVGVAYINAGKLLGGSYSNSYYIDRIGAQKAVTASLKFAENKGILLGGGNSYTLKFAEKITNVALFSSEYDIQYKSVPFWQLVVHGSVGYSSIPYNTSENRTRLLLKSIETGADLHFSFIGASDDTIIEKGLYEYYYSLSDDNRLETVTKLYGELYEFRSLVADKCITNHKEWAEGVIQTTYEGGAYSVVNYTDKDYKIGEINVPAQGYYLKGVE